MQVIYTEKAPKPIGPYSQAVKYENLIFISGQIAIDPSTNEFVNSDVATQTKIIMENIKAILEEAGINLNHVIKTTIFLKNLEDFQVVNEIYGQYFKDHKPARSTVEVSRLPKNALVEIEVIAGL
ncbi:putative endoribonuclease L-PSP [Sulfurihydrogenibium azorense Az-Fu1]|jgi:2-iminobutanoate/2-iminopropanoate deaminase|uniref:Putative endoribonuclease L-PSP n=1 Tax=Sulfurihydrogenibium azorense (strain DSM 15241 / OCM 825 / Az-Fu1) TaxID=204536 RepID=C1DTH0_SULAA|nr:RidA family protein [Sulfurihydrogenibium azorense]ACN98616.1 putative endoribonuclease L-PSP [Sulfurihydrogenibium azorense Az-Fu1]